MMRQSRQAVLPEISGNKTSSLRKSICSDLLTLFNSPHSALPSLLVSGMPEWQVHNQSFLSNHDFFPEKSVDIHRQVRFYTLLTGFRPVSD